MPKSKNNRAKVNFSIVKLKTSGFFCRGKLPLNNKNNYSKFEIYIFQCQ